MAQAFRCFFLRPLDRHPRQAPPRETMACHMDAVLQELAEHLDMPTLLSFGACGRAAHWLAMRAADDRARASFEGVCPLLGWGRPGPHWRRLGRSLKPRHRLHVRVTRRWSDLWCGHIGVPTWPNACRQQRVARSDLAPSALPPPKAARQRPLLPRGRSRVQPKAALLPPPRCGAERHPAAGGGPGHAGPVVRGVRADGLLDARAQLTPGQLESGKVPRDLSRVGSEEFAVSFSPESGKVFASGLPGQRTPVCTAGLNWRQIGDSSMSWNAPLKAGLMIKDRQLTLYRGNMHGQWRSSGVILRELPDEVIPAVFMTSFVGFASVRFLNLWQSPPDVCCADCDMSGHGLKHDWCTFPSSNQ
ncbi:unnamed protein product [Prorocentrum cordatum]|uniref:Uncharacterized protein n=1 Tax=Prorocentrum cordatum TaxID=2364126 RepID=A0ABN9TN56_9DINO|nr:unnamed protein product [Polarella glacialis]